MVLPHIYMFENRPRGIKFVQIVTVFHIRLYKEQIVLRLIYVNVSYKVPQILL